MCPISGNKAIINAGSIYCYETRQITTPIIASLYDAELISKYKKLTSTKKRIDTLSKNSDKKNIYAFVTALSHKIGAGIPVERFRGWLYSNGGIAAPEEIIDFIKCLSRARVNQSKSLIALDPKKFKHRLHLKQKNGLLDWFPAVEQIKKSSYRMVAVKAHHGQGKSQDFMRQMFTRAVSLGGAVAIAHRTKLVAQLAVVLDCIGYDDKQYLAAAGTVKDLACCLHSFKHEKFLNHLSKSHSIFIDEASQALKTFYTDSNIEEGLSIRFSQAAQEAQCIYLLDADLTESDIRRWAKLLEVNEDEILVITAEPPVRDFTVNLSCTASQRYFKTHVIEAIEKDLTSNTPCVLAVESKAAARSTHKYLQTLFPEKKIILLHGSLPKGEIDPFIENIQVEMTSTDLLIHTSAIGTGISIQHEDKRFKKGYGLFSGTVLSATECLQMLRRCRDVSNWDVTLLCRPSEMFMTSFYKDIGSIELGKVLDLDEVENSVKMEKEQNKSLFIRNQKGQPMELELKEGQEPTWAEKTGRFKGEQEQGKEAGKYRAKAQQEIGDSQLGLSHSGAVLDRMTKIVKNPVFQDMRSKVPFFQDKQLNYLMKTGTPEQKQLIGDFLSTAESFIASTVQGFGGRPLVREFDLAQRQKINPSDPVHVAEGKLRAAIALHDIAEKKNDIISGLLDKGVNLSDAVKRANKMVDVSAIEKQTEELLQNKTSEDDIDFTAKKHGMTREQVIKRLKAEGRYNG